MTYPFLATAKALECDESGKLFEAAMGVLAPAKKQRKAPSKQRG